jgi:hypothetical protein
MAQALELTVTAWSPLGGGLLTGRCDGDRARPDDTRIAATTSAPTVSPMAVPVRTQGGGSGDVRRQPDLTLVTAAAAQRLPR